MHQLYALLFCGLIALCSAQPIDDYTTNSVAPADAGNPVVEDVQTGAGFLGGERTLTATHLSGPLRVTASILSEQFSLSSDVGNRGISTARYTAPGGAPFSPTVDFTRDGCDCWNARLLTSDNQLLIEFEVEAGASSAVSSFSIPINVGPPGISICIPFAGDFAVYQAATALEIRLDGSATNDLDASITYVCCTPRVDCWHEFVDDDIFTGEVVSVKLTCLNYDSFPIRAEDIDVSFPFDDSIVVVENEACDSGVVPTINNNALEFSTTLIPNGMVMCTFDIRGVGGGTLTDIGAIIDIAPGGGTPARSNNDGPRSSGNDGEDLCVPPVLGQLVVQVPPTTLPPTTEPPTTEPPTTEPPTTEPPTTLPPTTEPPTTLPPTTLPPTTLPPTTDPPTTFAPRPATSVCVTPMLVDGQCTCTVFPCFTRDDGDVECEASEWYCIYYRQVPLNGIIEFEFRGVECTCMI